MVVFAGDAIFSTPRPSASLRGAICEAAREREMSRHAHGVCGVRHRQQVDGGTLEMGWLAVF